MLTFSAMTSDAAPRPYRVASRETWLATLLFTALAIAFAYPLSLHPATLRFPTGPDGDLGWYLLAWDTHAFLHKPWAIFDANIYYPQRFTLAYGENVIGIAFFAAPVIWLTGNVPLAANVVGLLSTILCGLGAYVLARRLGLSVAAAVITGIIWECAPPRFFRIGQMTLSSVEWIPFGLAALHAYLDEGRKRDLRLAAAFTSLQALSSGYGAVFMAVSLLLFAIYRVALGEPLRLVKRLRDLGVVGAALLLPTFLVYLPYRVVQHEAGLRRGLGSWERNYDAFLASPSHLHSFLLSLMTKTDVNGTANAYLFPGYLALVLAIVAVAWPRHPRLADTGGQASILRTRAIFVLDLALLVGVAVAGALTAGTAIEAGAGPMRLAEPRSAILAWAVCACLATLKWATARGGAIDRTARQRSSVVSLWTAILLWIILSLARPAFQAGNGLVAEYYANPSWADPPAFSVVDSEPSAAAIMDHWNQTPPDRFSVRWRGWLAIGRSAVYTFSTTSAGESQLTIDNHLVVDKTGPHGVAAQSGDIHLHRGPHAVVLRYAQVGADSALGWSWAPAGGNPSAIPAWALSQRAAGYATVVIARAVDWWIRIFAILTALVAARYVGAGLRSRPPDVKAFADALRRDATTFYAVLTIATVALALGPPYGLWQYVYWMPGFTFIRANSRFTIVSLLGLSVLAGIGFDRISSTKGLAFRRRAALGTLLCVLLVVEYAAMPMAVLPVELDVPAIDRWLDTRPKPFVVAEVPVQNLDNLASFERQEVDYMMHSTAHWQKTVHGYSGWRAALHWRLFSEMQHFPDETSIASLSDLGVTYVVVHTDLYPPGEWPGVEKGLEKFSCRLRLEHVEGAGRVYRFLRPDGEAVDRSTLRP